MNVTAYFKTKATRRNTIVQDPWHSRLLIRPWKLLFFGGQEPHRVKKPVRCKTHHISHRLYWGVGQVWFWEIKKNDCLGDCVLLYILSVASEDGHMVKWGQRRFWTDDWQLTRLALPHSCAMWVTKGRAPEADSSGSNLSPTTNQLWSLTVPHFPICMLSFQNRAVERIKWCMCEKYVCLLKPQGIHCMVPSVILKP